MVPFFPLQSQTSLNAIINNNNNDQFTDIIVIMRPRVEYKLHPKIQEIRQEKQKRRKILEQAENKEKQDLQQLKQEKKEYMEENKNIILNKKEEIYQKKLQSTNKIKQQQQNRYERIQEKKLQILQKYIPNRKELIKNLRHQYQNEVFKKEQKKSELKDDQAIKKTQMLEELLNPVQIEFNFKNVNEGLCVICLTQKAQLMMKECQHLIACKGCEFILRMNKKCPLCRKVSDYKSIYLEKKSTISKSMQKKKV